MSALRPGWLVAQLPRVLGEDDLTVRFVGALEEVAAEARAPLDDIDLLVDVDLAPAPFVRWLGSWIGVPVEEGLPERRQREVVRVAGHQFPWRGTRRGLRELIEAYTGHEVRVEDSGGVVPLAEADAQEADRTVTIHLPGSGGIDEHHLLRLVEQEIPADATVQLRIEDHAVEAEAAPEQLMEAAEEAEGTAAEGTVAEGPGPMAPRARSGPTAPPSEGVPPPPSAPPAADEPAAPAPEPPIDGRGEPPSGPDDQPPAPPGADGSPEAEQPPDADGQPPDADGQPPDADGQPPAPPS